jgi:hypothetical protein
MGGTLTGAGVTRPGVDPELRRSVKRLCEPGVIMALVQPIVRPADMVVVGYAAVLAPVLPADRRTRLDPNRVSAKFKRHPLSPAADTNGRRHRTDILIIGVGPAGSAWLIDVSIA